MLPGITEFFVLAFSMFVIVMMGAGVGHIVVAILTYPKQVKEIERLRRLEQRMVDNHPRKWEL
jgi:hypothetical protein